MTAITIAKTFIALGLLAAVSAQAVEIAAPVTQSTAVASDAIDAPAAIARSDIQAARAEVPLHPAVTYADCVLTEDTVWRGEVLVQGAVTVAPQTTLTVEPGTVVRFKRQGETLPGLMVQGRLVAQGSKDLPIIFASSFVAPLAGDWQGILLLGSEKKNSIEYCHIAGAETALEVLFAGVTLKEVTAEHSRYGMRFKDALIAMEGGGAEGCGTAFILSDSEANMVGVVARTNGRGIQAIRSSLYLSQGKFTGNTGAALLADTCNLKVAGGVFEDNGSGVTLTATEGSVSDARLAWNRRFGLSLYRSRMRITGNEITQNREAGIVTEDGTAVAWGNAISNNGSADVSNLGAEEFRAPGNWWGGCLPKIQNKGNGKVSYNPVLAGRPERR